MTTKPSSKTEAKRTERVEEAKIVNGYRVAMFNPNGEAFLAFTKSEHNAAFLAASPLMLAALKMIAASESSMSALSRMERGAVLNAIAATEEK